MVLGDPDGDPGGRCAEAARRVKLEVEGKKRAEALLNKECYIMDFHTSVLWNGWVERPDPKVIDEAISAIMENHSGTLDCIFTEIDTLLVFDWDCLNLSVYNPPKEVRHMFEQIALSEGLFWRRAVWNDWN